MPSNTRTGRPRNRPTVNGFPASRARGVYASSRSAGRETREPEPRDDAHQSEEVNGSSSSSSSTTTEQAGSSNTQENRVVESSIEEDEEEEEADEKATQDGNNNQADSDANELTDRDEELHVPFIDSEVQSPSGSPRATPVVPSTPAIPDNASIIAAYGSDNGGDAEFEAGPPILIHGSAEFSLGPPMYPYQSYQPSELDTHRRLVDQSLSAFGIDLRHDDRGRVSRVLTSFEKQFQGGCY